MLKEWILLWSWWVSLRIYTYFCWSACSLSGKFGRVGRTGGSGRVGRTGGSGRVGRTKSAKSCKDVMSVFYIQGVTGGTDQTSGECSLC